MVPPGTGDPGSGGGHGDAGGLAALAELAQRLDHARFTTAFRGFEPREVHALLAEAATLIRAMLEGSGDATAALDAATRIRRVTTAQDEAAEILRAAHDEAERIVDDAVRQAAEVRKEAAEFREQARATVLEGIRDANLLMQRAREERASATGARGPAGTPGSAGTSDASPAGAPGPPG